MAQGPGKRFNSNVKSEEQNDPPWVMFTFIPTQPETVILGSMLWRKGPMRVQAPGPSTVLPRPLLEGEVLRCPLDAL